MRKLFLLLLVLFFSISGFGQKLNANTALEHLQLLSSDSLMGRRTNTEGSAMARAYIIDRLSQYGVAAYYPDYIQHFPVKKENLTGTNIVGYIEGNYEASIVISAHYDHEGVKDSLIYNGADDNASGVAALLELASYFAQNQPDHTLIFCLFDAEELGLEGSKAFLKSSAVNSASIVLNVNMDMISRSEKGILYAVGTTHYPYLSQFLPLGKQGDYTLTTGHDKASQSAQDWTYSSDHGSFHLEKIPFIYFGVDDHEDYHKPTDTFEKIEPDFYSFSIERILETLLRIDQSLIEDNEDEDEK